MAVGFCSSIDLIDMAVQDIQDHHPSYVSDRILLFHISGDSKVCRIRLYISCSLLVFDRNIRSAFM